NPGGARQRCLSRSTTRSGRDRRRSAPDPQRHTAVLLRRHVRPRLRPRRDAGHRRRRCAADPADRLLLDRPMTRPERPEVDPQPGLRRVALWRSFSGLGLMLGALFFAASLTPSLIPRSFPLQGVLGGVCLAAGYGLGVLTLWLWDYLGLPYMRRRMRRIATWVSSAVAAVIVIWSLSQAADWQNSI